MTDDMCNLQRFEYDKVTSTFDVAKQLSAQYDSGVVIAKNQTEGRGKGERKFASNDGGLYFTVFYKNPKIALSDCLKTVINAGISVYSVLKKFGFDAKLKWPNDVLIKGKKVCGILCELKTCEKEALFMCGVGINVNSTCFDEFDDVATSLFLQSGKQIDIQRLFDEIIADIQKHLFDLDDKTKQFFDASQMFGKRALVTNGDEKYYVIINGLSPDGFLCGTRDGVQTKVVCGDVKEV